MTSWAHRRERIDELLPELAQVLGAASHSPNELIHLALLEVAQLELHHQAVSHELNQLRHNILSVDDFHSLATLSTSGPYARVELVQAYDQLSSKSSRGRVFVLKTLERGWGFRMRQQQFPRHELNILRLALGSRLPAARIPRLLSAFLSPLAFHLVLSHASGGDVWSLLERRNAEAGREDVVVGLEENWVRRWMAELVEVVEWLHSKGWAHRDIKPHNLLLTAQGHIQLTDFGSAAPLAHLPAPPTFSLGSGRPPPRSIARKYARALVGTPDYIAPEILHNAERVVQDWRFDESAEEEEEGEEVQAMDGEERAYGCEVDWWSLGVTVYELLYGQAPFFTESIAETYDRIVNHSTQLAFPDSTCITPSAQAFIKSLLVDAEKRPPSSTIKLDRWFAGMPWGRLDSQPPLFRPPPFTPPAVDFAQEPSHPQQNASLNFNLESAFFSSPGLSILRPSPKSSVAAQTEEHEYWAAGVEGDDAREGEGERGMTVMPLSDAFDPLEVEDECGGGGTSTATRPPRRAPTPAFETPARPSSRLGSDGTRDAYGWAGTPGLPASSGRRGRRNVSDVEAWKEMQERAWEVGMTARKLRSGSRAPGRAEEEVRAQTVGTAGNDEVAELERRRRAVLSDLDGLEEKYSRLFALANAA